MIGKHKNGPAGSVAVRTLSAVRDVSRQRERGKAFRMNIGERAWFYTREDFGYSVYQGEVVASGPRVVVIAVDGPWSNAVHQMKIVERIRCAPGNALRMGAESMADFGQRCFDMIDRPNQLEKLKQEARRLGVPLAEDT